MAIPLIIGLILLAVVIYIAMRIIGNVTSGIILIGLVLLASYFIFGFTPDFQSIPIIGKYLPKLPTSTTEAIGLIKDIFYNIDILSVTRDQQNNLLITVGNTGRLDISGFTVFIDEQAATITNLPKDPLKSKEVTVIQVNWSQPFTRVMVKTDKVTATFG